MVEAARADLWVHGPTTTYQALPSEGSVRLKSLALASGQILADVAVAYQLLGPADAPVVAVLGGISAHRYAASTPSGQKGWWGDQIGPGLALDTQRTRVLCWDYLGGNGATTGPRSGGCTKSAFPDITTADQAALLACLLDQLGIAKLHAFVGASYGGMVALQFGALFPRRVGRLLVLSAAHKSAPMAVAWRTLQRKLVEQSLAAGDGRSGLALARALAMVTYRTPEEFTQRFSLESEEPSDDPDRSPVWDYLSARGAAYIEQMHPRAFLCLSRSIDLHRLQPERLTVPLHLVAVQQDQLVPSALIDELGARVQGACTVQHLDSLYGHDAFLTEPQFINQLLAAL